MISDQEKDAYIETFRKTTQLLGDDVIESTDKHDKKIRIELIKELMAVRMCFEEMLYRMESLDK